MLRSQALQPAATGQVRGSPLLRPPSHTRPTRAVRACASAVWESQADTYYKDKKEEGDGGDAEGETGTS